jgi:MHS family proline/betaine transporter-like MFS transporter
MTLALDPIVPPDAITQAFRTPGTVQRGVAAGVVGNMLEWYDFALFGFFAPSSGPSSFPPTTREFSAVRLR